VFQINRAGHESIWRNWPRKSSKIT